jgi:RNA polymerase sigma factor (sigma-70 family)
MLVPDIGSLQAGDRAAWDDAFSWLWPIAWSAAKRRLVSFSPEDEKDVAMIAIREAAELVRDGEVSSFDELKALTGVIAYRRALDHVRRRRAERRSLDATSPLDDSPEPVSSNPGPVEAVSASDLARVLVDLAAKLPERPRAMLLAYYLHGQKQAELARAFGVPLGSVGVTLSRALETLRQELARHPELLQELAGELR